MDSEEQDSAEEKKSDLNEDACENQDGFADEVTSCRYRGTSESFQ